MTIPAGGAKGRFKQAGRLQGILIGGLAVGAPWVGTYVKTRLNSHERLGRTKLPAGGGAPGTGAAGTGDEVANARREAYRLRGDAEDRLHNGWRQDPDRTRPSPGG
jgi:hypothetical protein